MKVKIKPKTYGPVYVRADKDGKLLYGREAASINDIMPSDPTPADILLASIGGCMVLSVQIVASRKKLELKPFIVSVKADKAEDMPSRFGSYDIRVTSGFADDPQLEMQIVKQAKAMCTVSNSLNGEINLGLDG